MIEIRNLSKRYGEVRALTGVTFSVSDGTALVVFGPSGSGKTTLLRLIAGLELPDEGEIRLNGYSASTPRGGVPPHLRSIGFVFQSPALWPHMTVEQNVGFGLKGVPRNERRGRVSELIDEIGLGGLARRYPDQLSGGESRRVAVARALAPRPRILIMDEPLVNLDAALKNDLIDVIRKRACRLSAVLVYVTHDISEAKRISKRVITMERGRIKKPLNYPK